MWAVAAGLLTTLAIYGFFAYPTASDFWTFYHDGRAWWDGLPLYADTINPNLNPPTTTLLLFAPLAWLPYRVAQVVWVLLECGGLAGSLWVLDREGYGVRLPMAAMLVLVLHGTSIALLQGQLTYVLLYPITEAWAAYRHERYRLAGWWLAPAIAIKPPLALLALLLPWRVWLPAAALAESVSVGAFIVTGSDPWRAWLHAGGSVAWLHLPFNASLWGLAARWTGATRLRDMPVAAVLGVLLTGAWLFWRGHQEPDRDRRYLLAVLWSVLLSPLGWSHYLPLAFAPLVAIWPTGWVWWIAYVLLLVPVGGGPHWSALPGSICGIAVLVSWIATTNADGNELSPSTTRG